MPAIGPDDDSIPPYRPAASSFPPPFSVRVDREADRVVVAVTGEVDLATVERVARELQAAGSPSRVLDLREVTFLDSSGLRMVVDQQRAAERDGHHFALVAGPPQVRRLFDVAGLTQRLEFLGEDEAPGGDERPA